MTLNLWIDGQCLQTGSRLRGIGRYVEEFLRALSERGDVRLSMSFNAVMAEEALMARDRVAPWIAGSHIHMWESPREGGEAFFGHSDKRRLGAIALAHHVACLAPDVALVAGPFEGLADDAVPLEPTALPDCPVAAIFYDAIPYRFPARYLAATGLRTAYERRLALLGHYDLNLCISAFSAQEVTEIAGGGTNINIGAGVSRELLALRDAPLVPTPAGPYVLYVGALDWRKNVAAIVAAFALLKPALRASVRLVVVGPHDAELMADLGARWARAGLARGNLLLRSEVSDLELASLYRGATVLVNASYMEGFGLPALEAMSFGTPVIVARRGAAIEVVQDPELMFEPDDHGRIAAMISRMIEDRAYAAEKASAGCARATPFTWERTADSAVAALTRTARDHEAQGRPVRTLAERRHAALAAIQEACPDAADIAEVMARAEPETAPPARLFVDATAMIRHDNGTGIQRVTRNIANHLAGTGAIVIFGDEETPMSPALWDSGRLRPPLPGTGAIRVQANDTVLMLDSSWEFHGVHRPQLLAARLRGAQVVSVLYDFVPAMMPAFCADILPPIYIAWLRAALAYSSGFVCISRAVTMELHAILTAIRYPHRLKIGWWPLGADIQPHSASTVPATQPRSRPHFLMVGTIEPRKGYDVALAGFERLWAEGFDAELSIIGKQGWSTETLIAHIRAHPEAGRRLHLRGGVSDQEMAAAYATADCLISTSYAEGFGLPLVEARHFGKPAIVSDLPVFREVTTGAGNVLFFKPGNPDALAEAIRRFVAEPAHVRQMPEAWPNWEQSAERLRHILLQGGWQMEYQPDTAFMSGAADDIGATRMMHLLGPQDRLCTLETMRVEPLPGQGMALQIKVFNRSQQLWSSNLDDDGRLGFRLVGQPRDITGAPLGRPVRAVLPFVLVAGQQAIVSMQFTRLPPGTKELWVGAGQDDGTGGSEAWDGALHIAME